MLNLNGYLGIDYFSQLSAKAFIQRCRCLPHPYHQGAALAIDNDFGNRDRQQPRLDVEGQF